MVRETTKNTFCTRVLPTPGQRAGACVTSLGRLGEGRYIRRRRICPSIILFQAAHTTAHHESSGQSATRLGDIIAILINVTLKLGLSDADVTLVACPEGLLFFGRVNISSPGAHTVARRLSFFGKDGRRSVGCGEGRGCSPALVNGAPAPYVTTVAWIRTTDLLSSVQVP